MYQVAVLVVVLSALQSKYDVPQYSSAILYYYIVRLPVVLV